MKNSASWRPPGSWAGAYAGEVLSDVTAWPRHYPKLGDWALAAVLAAFSASQPPVVIIVSVVLAATIPVRHRYPIAAFAVGVSLGLIQAAFGLKPSMADLAVVVLLYSLAASRPRRISVPGLLIGLVATAVAGLRWAPAYHGPLDAAVTGLAGLALTAWVLGDSMAYRRAYYANVEERAARAEAERDAQARVAAAAERARELQEHRARAVDESAARLRGIERDLHDGAQVRLTALAMSLGEINECLDARDGGAEARERVRMLAGAAHLSAKEALTELRDLARGIHPPVLDRGLAAALRVLAESSAVRVDLQVSVAQRPSPAIESITYFCAAELLANVAKHSGASRATVSVSGHDFRLLMTVSDDGAGRARLAPGGGLAGLVERVQAVDGRLSIDSPPGGPTVITTELPVHA
jgi:signal transduction histidine kinase